MVSHLSRETAASLETESYIWSYAEGFLFRKAMSRLSSYSRSARRLRVRFC